jgi:putative nucleotidyltransferase with HDIG domain
LHGRFRAGPGGRIAVTAAGAQERPFMLHLRIISGASKGRTLALEEPTLPLSIGRDPDNTIALEHTAISRYHCRITAEGDAYFVEDLGSTNGTFLNGRRVSRERLSPGDELIMANVGMVVEASPESIHKTHSPLDYSVSIDSKRKRDNALTLSNPVEEIGTQTFLDGLRQTGPEHSRHALETLYRADRALRDIEDLKQVLENMLDLVMESTRATRGYVFLLQRDTGTLVPYVRRPAVDAADGDGELVVSQTILQAAVREKAAIISGDALVDERFAHSRSVTDLAVRAAMCAPLTNRGQVLGIVYVDSEKTNAFSRDDLALFSAMALKAGVAVDNARLYDDLRSLFYNTVETLVRTIQAKDPYTSGHSTRVSRYALLVAQKLDLSTKEKHQLYLASMLHDIGKIGVPDDLLNRQGKLSDEEMERVRSHVQLGASMIEMLGEMHPIVPLIRHHHEAWDGSGYPDGLRGEEIPLISRIISVADMYDAMTSDRPYRSRRSQREAIDEIKRTTGTRLDPRVAEAFLSVLKDIAPEQSKSAAAPLAT